MSIIDLLIKYCLPTVNFSQTWYDGSFLENKCLKCRTLEEIWLNLRYVWRTKAILASPG